MPDERRIDPEVVGGFHHLVRALRPHIVPIIAGIVGIGVLAMLVGWSIGMLLGAIAGVQDANPVAGVGLLVGLVLLVLTVRATRRRIDRAFAEVEQLHW